MSGAGDRAQALLAAAVGRTPEEVKPGLRLGDDGWDSLAHLRLTMALEETLGRALSSEETLSIDSLEDVARLLAPAPPPQC